MSTKTSIPGFDIAALERHQAKHGFAAALAQTKADGVVLQASTVSKLEVKAERATHVQICQELTRREIKYVHAAMNKRSTLPEGHPDFCVYTPNGKAVFYEVKTATGKLTSRQEVYISELRQCNYEVGVVRSFEEFMTHLRTYL